jgi:hypothetical protein
MKISDHDYVPVNDVFPPHKIQEFLNVDVCCRDLNTKSQTSRKKTFFFASHLTAITLKSASNGLYVALQQLFIVPRA